jgi:hypothetical protein
MPRRVKVFTFLQYSVPVLIGSFCVSGFLLDANYPPVLVTLPVLISLLVSVIAFLTTFRRIADRTKRWKEREAAVDGLRSAAQQTLEEITSESYPSVKQLTVRLEALLKQLPSTPSPKTEPAKKAEGESK